MALAGTTRSMRSRITSSRPLMTWITYHTSTTPLAVLRVVHGVWVWLRQGACARRRSISKPREPSQTSTWLCPTVNGMYKSSAEAEGTYRKIAYNLSWLRANQSREFKTGPHANS